MSDYEKKYVYTGAALAKAMKALKVIAVTSIGFAFATWQFVYILSVFWVEHTDDGHRGERSMNVINRMCSNVFCQYSFVGSLPKNKYSFHERTWNTLR